MYLQEEFIQMPQSVMKYSLIFATLTYLLSGCGGSGSGGGGDASGSDGVSSGKGPGNALVSWTPPTQNTDGSNLDDLAGYRIYYGRSSGNYSDTIDIDNLGLASFLVEGLDETTWCFAMTAVNMSGVESDYSEEACLSVTTS
jgi:hypothetical protein